MCRSVNHKKMLLFTGSFTIVTFHDSETYYKQKDQQKAKMNDTEFTKAYEKYTDMLFRFAVTMTGNSETATDVVQDVMLKLYQYRKSFESDEHLKHWLFKVCANRCNDHLRSLWVTRGSDIDPELHACVSEDFRWILDAILRLDKKYRSVIYLHYYEGYAYREIAKILHISETAVRTRAKRARDMLKIEMEEGECHE